MTILVIDYGLGNLHSVRRGFESVGASVLVSDNPKDLDLAERIVIPGVGGFGDGMRLLRERGWVEPLRHALLVDKVPCLGICLGMQLLADRGYEGRSESGLGVVPGEVVKLEPVSRDQRVPHVGWNEVVPNRDDSLFDGIHPGTDFYFVHSYEFRPKDPADCVAHTEYCGTFASAIRRGKVFGVQFHPEKSSHAGRRLLQNFVAYA
jgi:glutamine amidotransferase